jgi:hypothetical protein
MLTSLVPPVFEYGAACWDPYREGQINALDQVPMKAAQFTIHTSDFDWETLAQRRDSTLVRTFYGVLWGADFES